MSSAWFCVRCIFHWIDAGCFEERLTIWRAESIDNAIVSAEKEAVEYEIGDGDSRIVYVGVAQAYALPDDELDSGVEVFSLLRDSRMDSAEYVNYFFTTGNEHSVES